MNQGTRTKRIPKHRTATVIKICLLGILLAGFNHLAEAQFTYTTNNGSITITGCTNTGGAVTVPSTINGLPVTSIAEYAFYGTSITGVSIPSSVTSIGFQAFFYCTSLTAINVNSTNPAYSSAGGALLDKSQTTLIQYPNGLAGSYTIPNSVTTIGDYAFQDSYHLTGVTIGTNVTSIGFQAFQETDLSSVTIPNSVVSIGSQAFAGIITLSSLTLGTNVNSIGSGAFGLCFLSSVAIPASVASIGEEAFADNSALNAITVSPNNPYYSSLNGVLFDKNQATLLQFPPHVGGSYTVPGSVTSIGNSAFYVCKNLSSVTIPAGVTSIADDAFDQCTSLKSVYFAGNAPVADSTVFAYADANLTAYYLPGTIGWSNFSANTGIPTALWSLPYPLILSSANGNSSLGVQGNQFGFTISWAGGPSVVVETCTNLVSPVWQPLQTNTLTNGSFYFTDPQWTNSSGRFYRVSSF